MLSTKEKQMLLESAREAVFSLFDASLDLSKVEHPAFFGELGATFVSIYGSGELRGCMGSFSWSESLIDSVRRMAQLVVTDDLRFAPIEAEELGGLQFEISVLSPPTILERVEDIRIGVDGLILSRGRHFGVLLPQVAEKYDWDRETFLEQTCIKASLPSNAWRESDVKIERFQAEVFSELL